jgi:hypothetical protein
MNMLQEDEHHPSAPSHPAGNPAQMITVASDRGPVVPSGAQGNQEMGADPGSRRSRSICGGLSDEGEELKQPVIPSKETFDAVVAHKRDVLHEQPLGLVAREVDVGRDHLVPLDNPVAGAE